MAPNLLGSSSLFLAETTIENESQNIEKEQKLHIFKEEQIKNPQHEEIQRKKRTQIVWLNVFVFLYLHLAALYGLYLAFTTAKLITVVFGILFMLLAGMGITAGAHRLWTHRAYKANLPLRILLAIFQTMAFQNHIYEWVRDHRAHHKFTDTSADPHNAKRGFFFSHIGWLMVKKHKDVKIKGASIDMSDLESDPVVMFQMKYYLWLMPLLCFILPSLVPYLLWNETFSVSFHVAGILRYTLSLNGTWLVNSAAHIWGTKPYDKNISSTDSLSVGLAAFGEGWHNYHHVFPWDYKAAELGNYRSNVTTAFIDFFAKIGWAYDLKTVPLEMIEKRVQRTGDGSHPLSNLEENHEMIWGWDDKDMSQEDRNDAKIMHKLSKAE